MEITHSYEGISREYSRARKGTPRFAAFVVSHSGFGRRHSSRPLTIVELGVGSGQQTEFVERYLKAAGISQYEILAYDKSSDQIRLLKERKNTGEISERVVPIQHDFDSRPLPLDPASVDFSYMAWVFHHLANQQGVLNDIARITRRGAGHFMYQVTIEELEYHPFNEFFPTKYEYDRQRYSTLSRLRQMFLEAGFSFEKPPVIKQDAPRLIDGNLLESVENTSIDSVFRMIKDNDPDAFAEGVARLRKEVEKAERTGVYRVCDYSRVHRKVFWGIKQ
jgi:ubiquinone/menaquinone biosynthesis C-methylase UbiE